MNSLDIFTNILLLGTFLIKFRRNKRKINYFQEIILRIPTCKTRFVDANYFFRAAHVPFLV